MQTIASWCCAFATLSTLFAAKLLVWDIALADRRSGRAGPWDLAVCVAVALAVVGGPAALHYFLLTSGHAGWALLAALATFGLAALLIVIVAPGFGP